MISRVTIASSLLSCLLFVDVAVAQKTAAAKQGEEERPSDQPNEEFADLLKSRMFNAVFGEHTVPFSKEISIEAIVRHPVGNDVRGAWGRGIVRATRVDGKVTDESRVTFYVLDNDLAEGALRQGRRYVLTGSIRNGLEMSGRSAYSFELTRAPKAVDDRQAAGSRILLHGRTLNRDQIPHLRTKTRLYRLLDVAPWSAHLIGKSVQLSGVVGEDRNTIQVVSFSFPKLDELVGRKVKLVGTMWSMNDHWWFEHAGQKIVVSQIRKRPGWPTVGHGFRVSVTGNLEKELRPSLDQIVLKTCRDLVPHFVLKQSHIEVESTYRRSFFFAEIHDTTPTFSDGVLELHDEIGGIYNVMPWMNAALLLYRRNADLIEEIIRRDSKATRDVLKKRMLDPHRRFELRLLDAGILAAAGDDAGRGFLLEQAKERHHKHLDSVFWVIGNLHQFPPLPPAKPSQFAATDSSHLKTGPEGRVDMTSIARSLFGAPKSGRPLGKVEMQWAETLMIRALADDSQVQYTSLFGDSARARCESLAVQHGAFAHLLVKMNSEPGIPRLCELVADSPANRDEILLALLSSDRAEVVELAKKLIRHQSRDSSVRRPLQGYLLRHDRDLAIDDLISLVEETYAFRALLSLGKENVLDRLRARLPELDRDARKQAQLLMLLYDDAATALLAELKKQDGTSRNLVLYWLAQRTNASTATSVAALLESAPAEFFNEGEYTNTYAVQHAIDACRVDASRESVRALISLLDAELGRFDVHRKDEDWNRYIAAHLIELTDVSFGADKTKWQRWLEKN